MSAPWLGAKDRFWRQGDPPAEMRSAIRRRMPSARLGQRPTIGAPVRCSA